MKKMKKIMALMLAAIMTMAMAVTSFAAEGATKGTLTVNVKDGQTLANQTVNIYKLFDMTVSGTNYGYKVNSMYTPILDQVLGVGFTDKTDQGYYDAVQKATDTANGTNTQKFANDFTKELLKYNTEHPDQMIKETSTRSFDEDATDTTFNVEGLDFGYYLVCQTGTKEIQSSLVPVVSATATVNLKTQAPDITKTADKDATTVHVGQTVTYTITGQVPDMTGYSNYVYKIHDTLTNGLDFVTNEAGNVVVTVKIGEATYNDVVGAISKDNERNMTIDLSEKVKTAATGAKIEVTYQAKVNKNAVVETKNSATLEYSNKPGTDATGTTKPSEVVTPTYPLDVKKTDTKDIMLAGAHFKLYASTTDGNIDKNAVIKVTKDVENTDGEYTYAADQSAADTIDEMVTVASAIDGNYNLHINGLAAGIYYLEETQAPDGYNKLSAPVKVTIKKTSDTEWTITKDNNETPENDKIIDIQNSTGSLLPSTGGRGAIAFSVIAALLVFGVAVSFIRDKRKEA